MKRTTARLTRIAAAGVGGLGLLLGPAAGAWAYDCYQASRSDQGNVAAGNSQAWVTFPVAAGFAEDFGSDTELYECVLEGWTAAGGPTYLSIHVKGATGQGGVIGANNPNADRYTDGRGIDHLEEGLFPLYEQVVQACGGSIPN
jgi:hypothetical protein